MGDVLEGYSITIELLALLFLVSCTAGFIDTLAGGGGLIVLPALVLSGIPPLLALGTNKLQGTAGTVTATYLMLRNRKVRWAEVKYLMLTAFIGAALGTVAVQFLNTEVLTFVIPFVLLFIALYFLIEPLFSRADRRPRLSKMTFQRIVVPAIGWYDGMFGPGTGSFFAFAGVSLRGQGLIEATAIAKTLNFSTNIASLLVFFVAGKVVWSVGAIMMFGQFLGSWCGSNCLFRIHPGCLRLVVVVMCLAMLGKYVSSMGWL